MLRQLLLLPPRKFIESLREEEKGGESCPKAKPVFMTGIIKTLLPEEKLNQASLDG